MVNDITRRAVETSLTKQLNTTTPGIQYLVLDEQKAIFEFVGGWADIRNRKPMGPNTTLMAYSMTKTFTAVAILQLMEQGKLGLDDPVRRYLPGCPYPEAITIRQLISHTSGIPNPIPLRWVHLAAAHQRFNERAALAKVLQENPRLSLKPGTRYAYSNIGYWLLGRVIEAVTNSAYIDYMSDYVLKPLGLEPGEIGFVIPDPLNHAKGYLGKYSMMNLLKGFLTDGDLWGDYEGKWLEVRSHYVNGPAFGGLIGGVSSFGRFLQDQLRESSVLLGPQSKDLLYTEQTVSGNWLISMTLGWHIGEVQGIRYFFKEGGGGGFHGEMRIYPTQQLASVVLVNSTEFNSNTFLSHPDAAFLAAH